MTDDMFPTMFRIQGAAKLKVILQKGLETIRCLRDHGIDPRILIYMANAFWEKVGNKSISGYGSFI